MYLLHSILKISKIIVITLVIFSAAILLAIFIDKAELFRFGHYNTIYGYHAFNFIRPSHVFVNYLLLFFSIMYLNINNYFYSITEARPIKVLKLFVLGALVSIVISFILSGPGLYTCNGEDCLGAFLSLLGVAVIGLLFSLFVASVNLVFQKKALFVAYLRNLPDEQAKIITRRILIGTVIIFVLLIIWIQI